MLWWKVLVMKSQDRSSFGVSVLPIIFLRRLPDFSRQNSQLLWWNESLMIWLLWSCISWCRCPVWTEELIRCSVWSHGSLSAGFYGPGNSCYQTRKWCSRWRHFPQHQSKKSLRMAEATPNFHSCLQWWGCRLALLNWAFTCSVHVRSSEMCTPRYLKLHTVYFISPAPAPLRWSWISECTDCHGVEDAGQRPDYTT